MKGVEDLWVIGDNFGFHSFNKFYCIQEPQDKYMVESFEISDFHNDKDQSYDKNTLSRLRNSLLRAIKEKVRLPKIIVVVMDNDLIKFIRRNTEKHLDTMAAAYIFEQLMKWLMAQYTRLIASQKEYLPKKVRPASGPTFVWIEPPIHDLFGDNKYHLLFGKAISRAAMYHDNNYSLQLKKVWDPADPTLYCK